MQKCKDVIPCWIMPLQQLADTITPQQEMYDYIIVDEASQLGIDAMLSFLAVYSHALSAPISVINFCI
jgi:hypothetical protein